MEKQILENDIMRFIEAQENPLAGYEIALAEIEQGRKMSHWIWYIFPQLRGLGHSRRSHFYGIADRKEAKDLPDPHFQTEHVYRICFDTIERGCTEIIKKINI